MSKASLGLNSIPATSEITIKLPFLELQINRDQRIISILSSGKKVAALSFGVQFTPHDKLTYYVDEVGKAVFLMRQYDSTVWALSLDPYLQIRQIEISKREDDPGLQYLNIYKCDEWYVFNSEYEYAVYDVDFERCFISQQNPFSSLDHSFQNGILWFLPSPPDAPKKKAIEFYSWNNLEADLTDEEMAQYAASYKLIRKFIPGV